MDAAPLHTDQERKDNGVCWPFQKGHCKFGDDCRFEHASEAGTKPRRVAMVNMALAGEAEAYIAQVEAMQGHIDQMESRMLALGIEPQEQSGDPDPPDPPTVTAMTVKHSREQSQTGDYRGPAHSVGREGGDPTRVPTWQALSHSGQRAT